jgi:hypothetical protein
MSTLISSNTLTQSQALISIENIVSRILVSKFSLDESELIFFDSLQRYLIIYSPLHSYSPLVELFWRSCGKMNWFNQLPQSFDEIRHFECYIRTYSNRMFLAKKNSDWLYEAKQRQLKLNHYSQTILQRYARVLVIRVDLGYIGGTTSAVTIDQVYSHLYTLLMNKAAGDGGFINLKGYAWCIEHGIDKGYHIHLACFYAGYQHQSDWFIANSIGHMWLSIVGSNGMFYSCNTNDVKDHYRQQGLLGVGMIYRDNDADVQNAINTISYLADPNKRNQALRMRPKRSRTFATGQI